MALGRRASAEPLSSEDMALLSAVAAQAATALENGRLYRQLRMKADELERMREFSENILESLNDGLAVVNRENRVVRWNRRLEELYGVRHEDAVGRRLGELFDPMFMEVLGSRRESAEGAAFYRVPLPTRHDPSRRLLVNVATTPLRDSDGADRRNHPDHRGHLQPGAARGAAADLREDGVDRPARRRRGARGQHAADRHLELHADAAAERRAGRSADQGPREDRAADLPRREDRQRPAQPGASGAGRLRPDRSPRRRQRRALAARAPAAQRQHPGAQGAAADRRRSSRGSSTSCSRCS